MPDFERMKETERARAPETIIVDAPQPEILFEEPLSKGDVAPAPGRARREVAEDRALGDAPFGRDARRAIDFADVPEAVGEASARFVAGIADAVDEVTDEQAMAFANRRNAARAANAAAERVDLGNPVFDVDGVDEPVRNPMNLPALVERAVVYRDPEWQFQQRPVEPEWHQIYDLPGFYSTQIRALGRFVFRQFPCFARQEEAITAVGQDPLGAIRIITPLARNDQAEMDTMATWIRANGVGVYAAEMEFEHFQGYRPEFVLCTDADNSYLLVRETIANGAPVDMMYVYTWAGGHAFYRDERMLEGLKQSLARIPNPAQFRREVMTAMGGMGGMRGGMGMLPGPGMGRGQARPDMQANGMMAAARRGAAGVANALGFAGAQRQPPAPARQAPVRALPQRAAMDAVALRSVEAEPVRRKRVLDKVPVAAVVATTSDAVAGFRAKGFRPCGTDDGAGLSKSLDDGRTAIVLREPGKSLPASTSFRLRIVDEAGAVLSEDRISGFDEAEPLLSAAAPGLR